MDRRNGRWGGYGKRDCATASSPRYAAYVVSAQRTIKLTLSYDGTDFSGWQVQPDRSTVQGCVEDALARIEDRDVRVQGSGRTDAGVHALGQVASFTLLNPIPAPGLLKALNRLLPPTVRVLSVDEVAAGFHARHSALSKTYEYRIQRAPICPPFEARYAYWHPYPLFETLMMAAARRYEGRRDFRSFASTSRGAPESTTRHVLSSVLEREGDHLVYRVRGSGFLYRMVRNFVGTLLEVGRGNVRPTEIERILNSRDRREAGPTAPARGLFLASVEYEAAETELLSSSARQ